MIGRFLPSGLAALAVVAPAAAQDETRLRVADAIRITNA